MAIPDIYSKNLARYALAALGGVIYALALPPFDYYLLGWVALVPLIIALYKISVAHSIMLGLTFGLVEKYIVFFWVFDVPGFEWYQGFLLALFWASAFALWCGALSVMLKRRDLNPLYAAAWWVLIAYLYANAGFLAMPWDSLAHGQNKNLPILQIAGITGEYGIIFLVALFNFSLATLILEKRVYPFVLTGLLVLTIGITGLIQLRAATPVPTFKVATVQPAIPIEQHQVLKAQQKFERHARLTEQLSTFRADLIVWPESAISGTTNEEAILLKVDDLAQSLDTSILIGLTSHRKYLPDDSTTKVIVERYNSAVLRGNAASELVYNKNILLPFAEVLPLPKLVQWPEWLIPKFKEVIAGTTSIHFSVSNATVIPIICWENLFSSFVRQSLKGSQNGILVHLVNDNWFGLSSAPKQHNASSVLRAIENRIPVVIASNLGPSAILDSHGRLVSKIGALNQVTVISANVALRQKESFYGQYGDWIVFICLLLSVASFMPSAPSSSKDTSN